ncbi:hypothetical protein BDR26DRAFT_814111 [Obelidium mucronatum]|nr:hypothetical protein BDR26DRAFT_814111 [Obelidium mucronatum]
MRKHQLKNKKKERDLSVVEKPKKPAQINTKPQTTTTDFYKKHFANDRVISDSQRLGLSEKREVTSLGCVSFFGTGVGEGERDGLNEAGEPEEIPQFLGALNVKERLIPLVQDVVETADLSVDVAAKKELSRKQKRKLNPGHLSPITHSLFPLLNTYKDVLVCSEDLNSVDAEAQARLAYVVHAVNHVLKSRDRVLKNTLKLNKAEEKERSSAAVARKVYDTSTPEYRDQGFTRPKILILIPFKNIAFDVISLILKLSGASQIENKSRFTQEFTVLPEEDGIDPSKPVDFQHDFRGNIDDCFRIGIKFSRRHLKLFSDFYSADIIVASPLGLRMVVGAEGDRERDFDYLSSIEMTIIDRCDMLLMQNWDHVTHLFNHLNIIPKSAHDCDFARIKSWYLDGRASLFRQNIIFSRFNAPEINALITKQAKNVDGRIKISSSYPGSIGEVVVQVPQMFSKLQCVSLQTHDDDRFKHFCNKIIPLMRRNGFDEKGTLIFVPSYLDFVRVRNYLKDQRIEFGELCEYTPQSDISRNRSNFFHKKLSLLLMTERFHFFRRYKIRGVKSLIFYQLPEYPQFYPEVLNSVEKGMDSGCQVMYSLYDRLRLERIVGTGRVTKMMEKETFLFA